MELCHFNKVERGNFLQITNFFFKFWPTTSLPISSAAAGSLPEYSQAESACTYQAITGAPAQISTWLTYNTAPFGSFHVQQLIMNVSCV